MKTKSEIKCNKFSLFLFASLFALVLALGVVLSLEYHFLLLVMLFNLIWFFLRFNAVFIVNEDGMKLFTPFGTKRISYNEVESIYHQSSVFSGVKRSVYFKIKSTKLGGIRSASFPYLSRYHVCELLNFVKGKVEINNDSFKAPGIAFEDEEFVMK